MVRRYPGWLTKAQLVHGGAPRWKGVVEQGVFTVAKRRPEIGRLGGRFELRVRDAPRPERADRVRCVNH
jgi:hypothetical protein